MKSLIIKSIFLGLIILGMWSCKKDENRAIATAGTAPALTSTSSTLVLKSEDASKMATTFSWTKANFGQNIAVNYTLQIDFAGNNFKAPKEFNLSATTSKAFTVADFNDMVNLMGLTPGTDGKLEVRTKAEIGTSFAPVYSNVVTLTVNPYLIIINYPSLYLPGSYQGWNPSAASKVSSVTDNKVYEGYFNFPDASTEFKFTSDPDWNHTNYGVTAGKLVPNGGDNIKQAGAGYYLVKANLNDLSYSLTKTTWAVIGDATPGKWDNDTPLTYDATSMTWKGTLTLTTGQIKFRANGAWDINLGDNKPANGKLKYGGENINVSAAGTYVVTLNLSTAGNYTYSLKKQ